MLSVRVIRDRRGYDHIYLIEETRRHGRPEGRLLYWSRSLGGVRVGREVFDAETREAIEKANPGITFDWPALLKSAIASAAAARWNARQQPPTGSRPAGPPPGGQPSAPRGDRSGRKVAQSASRRSWREDGDEAPEDSESAVEPATAVEARPQDPDDADEGSAADDTPTF